MTRPNTYLEEKFWPVYIAIQDTSISDETIMDRFETGIYTEFHPDFYSMCLPSNSSGTERKTLFAYFIRKGFPLRANDDEKMPLSQMAFIASMGGIEWVKFAVENYPRKLTLYDLGSSICNAASGRLFPVFKYLVDNTEADRFWWCIASSFCTDGCVEGLEYCLLNDFPIRPDYCLEFITKYHPEMLEKSDLIRKYFVEHDDLGGRIKTLYMMDRVY